MSTKADSQADRSDTGRRVFAQPALTGLLVICGLLAGGLVLTAYLSHMAANRAARDVLYARASQAAASFASTVRLTRAAAPEDLRQLADDLGGDDLEIEVVDLHGEVVAAPRTRGAPASRRGARKPPLAMHRDLGLTGSAHSFDETHQQLVYWHPLGPKHVLQGGHARHGAPRWRRDDSAERRELDRWWRRPGWRRRWLERGDLLLLRVTVPYASASALVSPARTTLITALGGSALLALLGALLFRAGRRAQRAERQLQRKEALSALGEMAAVLAHEIRTPLASIKGNAQLIGENHPHDDRARSIAVESSRLERLVNGLLDYAQPPAPRRQACDPDALLERAAGIVAPRAQKAGVGLVTDPAGCAGDACLSADPDQVLQVLVNLLQNAIEATAEQDGAPAADSASPPPVVARVRRRLGRVVFTVLDRGPGFGNDPVDKLLRPFYTTKKQRGTGLGLSIARQIVQQHNGELKLENRPDGGASVTVTLPARSGLSEGP